MNRISKIIESSKVNRINKINKGQRRHENLIKLAEKLFL